MSSFASFTANCNPTIKMAQFEVEAFTLLAIALVAIAIRVAARWTTAGPGNFQLDDYLMPLAGVLSPHLLSRQY